MAKRPESPRRKHRTGSSRRARQSPEERYGRLEAFDLDCLSGGENLLAGVDEAGRGALAGPVVAAAVILPRGSGLVGVNDSKRLSEAQRESLFASIVDKAVSVGIGVGHPNLIDSKNILNATLIVMARAIANLKEMPHMVLVDGRDSVVCPAQVVPVIGGDEKSLSIAAASIVAKVARDRLMRRLHRLHPGYNFENNKGYGTQEHLEAIERRGLTPIHRRSYHLKTIEKSATLF
ncbi:MAG: ribonuclease HII [Candidatus Latescibacterota bacterium]|nr:MAG: ribonuclease HII [Candidatus Latescibacterota bacterium]